MTVQVDDELLEQQRQAYKVEGVEDETVTASQLRKKRKKAATGDEVCDVTGVLREVPLS